MVEARDLVNLLSSPESGDTACYSLAQPNRRQHYVVNDKATIIRHCLNLFATRTIAYYLQAVPCAGTVRLFFRFFFSFRLSVVCQGAAFESAEGQYHCMHAGRQLGVLAHNTINGVAFALGDAAYVDRSCPLGQCTLTLIAAVSGDYTSPSLARHVRPAIDEKCCALMSIDVYCLLQNGHGSLSGIAFGRMLLSARLAHDRNRSAIRLSVHQSKSRKSTRREAPRRQTNMCQCGHTNN